MTSDTLALIIVLLLTLNLLVVGFYVVLVLREAREVVRKMNSILGVADDLANSLVKPVVDTSGFFVGLAKGIKVYNKLKHKGEEEDG